MSNSEETMLLTERVRNLQQLISDLYFGEKPATTSDAASNPERVLVSDVNGDITVRNLTADRQGEGVTLQGNTTGNGNIAFIAFRDSGGTRTGFVGDAASGDSDTYVGADSGNGITFSANGATKGRILNGLVVGSPTGGDKGNGTANFAGDIYKNNSAYTNPDYVLEFVRKLWAGEIEAPDRDEGGYRRYTLDEVKAHVQEHLRLPGIDDRPMGMFARADFLLEKVEELFTHLIELKEENDALRERVEVLENAISS